MPCVLIRCSLDMEDKAAPSEKREAAVIGEPVLLL